jgi:hypothetical protein
LIYFRWNMIRVEKLWLCRSVERSYILVFGYYSQCIYSFAVRYQTGMQSGSSHGTLTSFLWYSICIVIHLFLWLSIICFFGVNSKKLSFTYLTFCCSLKYIVCFTRPLNSVINRFNIINGVALLFFKFYEGIF